MSTDKLPPEAEAFLKQLRSGLSTLPAEERDDIIAEVRSHLRDRQNRGDAVLLSGFEDAQTYASRFVSETALRGALAHGTSMALSRAILTGTATGISLLLTIPLVVTQLIGGAFVVAGALKPFAPTRVGLFLDPNERFVALGAYGGDVHELKELLGPGAMPLFIIGGIVLLWASNRALRFVAARKLAWLSPPDSK